MSNTRAVIVALLGSLVLTIPTTGRAGGGGGGFGGIVFDPTNYVQNTIAAVQAVRHEALMVSDALTQARQLYAMYQQLKALGQGNFDRQLDELTRDIAAAVAYRAANESVYGALREQGAYAEQVRTLYGASKEAVSWGSWIRREAEMAQRGDARARLLFDQADRIFGEVERTNERRRALQGQLATTEGTHQAVQTTNQYLDTITAQNGTLQSAIAAQMQAGAARDAEDSAKRDAYLRNMQDERRRRAAAEASATDRWRGATDLQF